MIVHYKHDECGTEWTDYWECACDSECPECGYDIEAAAYHEDEDVCDLC